MAAHYDRVSRHIRSYAEFYAALSNSSAAQPNEDMYGTMAPLIAATIRNGYQRMAAELVELAECAERAAQDYRAGDFGESRVSA